MQGQDLNTLIDALSANPQFSTVRGRETIVQKALGGYPLGEEIERQVLGWLNWEGDRNTVANDLVRRLDGREAAPGVEALALLAQTIEPMANARDRKLLAELRRRSGWSLSDATPPAAASTWRDDRAPSEVVQELVIGENTLRHMYYLRRALAAADAVVRIVNGDKMGTGFLVAPDLVMTNHHVIEDDTQARGAEAWFFDELPDFQRGEQRALREPVAARTADEGSLLYTNKELDVSLVRLGKGVPCLAGHLAIRPVAMKQNERVAIIQHPGGGRKMISLQNNLVAEADARRLQYYTSTQAGSSGSPVLDGSFAVVAIHHGYVCNAAWDGEQARRSDHPKEPEHLQYRNEGTSMIAVLEDLEQSAPALRKELTVVESAD